MESSEKEVKPKGIPAEDIDALLMKRLYLDNRELFEQIELPLFQHKYTKKLDATLLARIACDKEFQHKFLALNDAQYDLFLRCLKTTKEHGANPVTATGVLVNALQNPKFSELVAECSQNSAANVEMLNIVLNSDENYFNIKMVAQLNNYQAIKRVLCKKILREPDNESFLTEPLKKMSALDRAKFALCEQQFGISLSQAKLLCQKYGWGINNSDEKVCDGHTHEFLQKLTDIINAPTVEKVAELSALQTEKPENQTFTEIDTALRKSFAQAYNRSFYKPQEKDKIATELYEGKSVSVYNAGTEFTMCSHVIGAYSPTDTGQNAKAMWNIPERESHVFCTRLIANEALEVAVEDKLCYGFTDFEEDALIASAPWDMASIKNNVKFDTVGDMDAQKYMNAVEGSGARFLMPFEQINNTRDGGSETNWDRFNHDGTRKQPNYVIFIAESLDDGEYKNSPSYQMSVRAAAQFDIPVVVVDREEVIANEHRQIGRLVEEYKQTRDPQILNRLFQRFENNRTTGYNQHYNWIYEEEFPLLKDDRVYFKSLQEITEDIYDGNPEHAQQMVDALSALAVRSSNQDKEFCEIIYGIKEKCPSVKIDLDKHLRNYLGITQKPSHPQRVSQYYFKSFHQKREQEKLSAQQRATTAENNVK